MSEAATRGKLSEVLALLEKPYGKVIVLPEEPILDHAVFLLLRESWDYRKAQRALRILQKEFVDWNEVRVSSPAELKSVLSELGDKDLDVKVEKLRALLAALWKERNATALEFLKEMQPESRQRLLTNLGVLSQGVVQVLLQCMAGKETLLVHNSAVRTLTRFGLMDRVHSDGAARKVLEKLLEGEDVFSYQMLVTQHGEDVCQAKSPRCGDCVLVEACKFKRKVGVGGAAGGTEEDS
jgi:endonuclease-3